MEETTTVLINVKPEVDKAVIALYEQSLKLEQYAIALVITSVDNIKSATNDLSIISGLKKAIEGKRKEYTQPINDHLKAVNEAFKTFTEPLTQADQITRQKILAFKLKQQLIREEQERINALRLEAAKRDASLHNGEISESVNLVEVIASPPNHIRTDMGTGGIAKIWKFEVIDFALLPNDYKLPDMVKIRKVITAGASIPGVKAWQEETLRVSTRKED